MISKPKKYEFTELDASKILNFRHVEDDFNDFERYKLIYRMLSTQGPHIAKGDVNGDKLEDVYICGAKDSPGALYLQNPDGTFRLSNQPAFEADKTCEDTDAKFFDADGDGDLDLYVASGSSEFPSSSTALIDRLYINDGKGNFTKSDQILPTTEFESTSCVRPADYDKDGDQDLFVGVRLKPSYYGIPVNGYILQNDGHGKFTDVTEKVAPGLKNIGMITDMQWADIDNDGDLDMVIVGDYMPITIFVNENGHFVNETYKAGLDSTNGWWNTIKAGDFNHDGKIDFVIGNQGLNSRFKATRQKPVTMYVNDFDVNGSAEQIICTYNGDKSYPLALKHDLVAQIPSLKSKYPKYEDYEYQTITDIFTPKQLENAVKDTAYYFASSLLLNEGNDKFKVIPLPVEAQFSIVYGIDVEDFDGDGNLDIALGGNLYAVKPEVGRYDASYGLILKGNGDGTFKSILPRDSGMRLFHEVRDITSINTARGRLLLVARNNDTLQIFKY